jgi:type II secretory pathway component GspD/PulD (secretin)
MFSSKNLLLFATCIVSSAFPCKALASQDSGADFVKSLFGTRINESIFLPPQLENKALGKTVDFSFHETKISEIFLLLSKIGDFNLVMPQEYDKKINISLHNKTLIDAIKDVTELAGLNYVFEKNTLIVSSLDISRMSFEAVPVLYMPVDDLVQKLNEVLFRQLILSQEEYAIKPYAFSIPLKNSAVIAGNEEQIQVAKSFIEAIDREPFVKIYALKFLTLSDAVKILEFELHKAGFNLLKLEENRLLISGQEREVLEAIRILESKDLASDQLK